MYNINLGAWSSVFAVPCSVVDEEIRLAGEKPLKVLLYILRHSGRDITAQELSVFAGISEGDVADAVEYWRQRGVIAVDADGKNLSPAERESSRTYAPVQPPQVCADVCEEKACVQAQPTEAEKAEEAEKSAPKPKAKERIRYSYDECVDMMAEDEELRQLLGIVEGILAKQLNHTEISAFITLAKWYGLSIQCIAIMVEYCRSIGKTGLAYIEAMGVGWANDDITTLEKANERVGRMTAANICWRRLRELLDIPARKATQKESECCCRWFDEWHSDDELIKLAYERCVDRKGKLSISYMNGIMEKWHKSGITTVEQARAESAPQTDTKQTDNGRYAATYEKSEVESVLDDDWLDD